VDSRSTLVPMSIAVASACSVTPRRVPDALLAVLVFMSCFPNRSS
jgi:hypothetical protein